jgi:predicted AlkP superfamily phosphohydrolase/phosphomutase
MQLFRRKKNPRVLVLGLDCASPDLVFDQFRPDLPHLSRLMSNGTWGVLNSSIPCITVPAWASMTTSRDPGVLGCYGFRNRADYSYEKMTVASASDVKAKRVWDYLGEAGKQSVIVGVPQTYPVRPLNGHMIAGFPVSGTETAFTYPAILKSEVLKIAPDYPFDIGDFRTEDKGALLQRILDFTEIQYGVVEHLLKTKTWDFFMHVNMGTDRIHHGFWRFHDSSHRLYQEGNPFQHAIRDYYKLVDEKIGRLLQAIGDDVIVMVVSDHGVKRMDGGICLNEWLWKNGWLSLKIPPVEGEIMPFDERNVDWSKTRAWGSGGYYGRISLNIAGREPQGIIPQDEVDAVSNELATALKQITALDGQLLPSTQVFKPSEIYQKANGVAPDLLVYFGDLHWRSVGSLGHGKHYTLDNDTGPDDANHAVEGMFIVYEPKERGGGQIEPRQLMDIAPTILDRMGVEVPPIMQGSVIEVRSGTLRPPRN